MTGVRIGSDSRVFLLESRGVTDYVISMAVGWAEGVLRRTRHGFFNAADRFMPCWPTKPLHGADSSLRSARRGSSP